MLLQTNSYIVPEDKRADHARVIRRFRQVLRRLGCDHFEVYEQVGANWSNGESGGRYVQILRFVDRKHQLSVQSAERSDPTAQQVIADFCDLINFPYQQQQGLFAVGFYTSVLPVSTTRGGQEEEVAPAEDLAGDPAVDQANTGSAAPVGDTAGFAAGVVAQEAMTELVDEPSVHAASEHLFADEPVGQSVIEVAESAEHLNADSPELNQSRPSLTPHDPTPSGDELQDDVTGDRTSPEGFTLEDLAGMEPAAGHQFPVIESFEVGTGLEGEIDPDDEVPHMPVPPEPPTPPYMRMVGEQDLQLDDDPLTVNDEPLTLDDELTLTDEHEVHGLAEPELAETELAETEHHDHPHGGPRQ